MKGKYLNYAIYGLIIIIIAVGVFVYFNYIAPKEPKIVFKLIGDETVIQNYGDPYEDLGVSLIDDGVDMSNNVIVQNNIDINNEGKYYVTYRYKELSLIRNVEVKKINYLVLSGDEDVYLLINGKYDDPKASAYYDGMDVSDQITINDNVNYNNEGLYHITYSYDKMNKILTRNIHISDFSEYFKVTYDNSKISDNITLNISIDNNRVKEYILPDGNKRDDNSVYNVNSNGTYKFTIYDQYGNSIEKEITVSNIRVISPLSATCKALAKDGKTTVTVTANNEITKYIYNNVESKDSTYVFNEIVINNKVKLIDIDNQSLEISCETDLGKLEIHFIKHSGFYDDAILIRSDNATIFIDGGRGASDIVKYLKELNVKKIDYVIGSHTEYDHIDAQGSIIKNFDVKNALYANSITNCGCACDNKDVRNVLSALNKKKMTPIVQKAPSTLVIGDMTLYFLAPFSIGCNKNNNSFIFILQYGNTKFMFTGDADSALYHPEKLLANAKKLGLSDINVDVVKYPHHGNQNIPDNFLDATKPKTFVVPNINTSDKPSSSVSKRITSRGIKIYRQSDSKTGNILISSDGKTVSYKMDVKASTYAK